MIRHIGVTYQCDKCQLNFPSQYNLNVHLDNHKLFSNKRKKSNILSYDNNISDEENPLDVNLMNDKVKIICATGNHSEKKRQTADEDLLTDKESCRKTAKTHQCSYCLKSFHARSHLERHLASHSTLKPFLCAQCGKQFSQITTLQRHQWIKHGITNDVNNKRKNSTVHEQINKYRCEFCLTTFSLQHNLKAHVKKLHISCDETDKQKHLCPYCSLKLTNISALNKHISYRHGKQFLLQSSSKSAKRNSNCIKLKIVSDNSNKIVLNYGVSTLCNNNVQNSSQENVIYCPILRINHKTSIECIQHQTDTTEGNNTNKSPSTCQSQLTSDDKERLSKRPQIQFNFSNEMSAVQLTEHQEEPITGSKSSETVINYLKTPTDSSTDCSFSLFNITTENLLEQLTNLNQLVKNNDTNNYSDVESYLITVDKTKNSAYYTWKSTDVAEPVASLYNTRSTSVKRLMREAMELKDPTELFATNPIEQSEQNLKYT
ncbi:unnamed protein product [Didymodactylos carnosus]|uniref:C2H2-type domain-containing protein n=1 Tax=Didymodactylos carnosus TaxID=1234261 RepID=A0A8S2R6I8_9BILA|nr:unnamed protein product [Didymodactylos carnosus]CAF4147625.1 unnamed protein product [Didymodactylos carnosus]